MLSQEEGSREGGKRANLDAEEVLFCMVSLYNISLKVEIQVLLTIL